MTVSDPAAPALCRTTLETVRQWRLHLGAHKTATTHLQHTLAAVRPALLLRGVDFIPTEQIRPVGRWRLRQRNWRVWASNYVPLGTAPMARELEAALASARTGSRTVILSEENFLGEANTAGRVPLYSKLDWRLAALNSLGRNAEVKLFFSIRRMDQFLASAYAEALRYFAPTRTLAAMKEDIVASPPRWSDVIARIRRAMPGATIEIWRYEDYQANSAQIIANFCGADPGPLPDLPRPSHTMSPSAEAVARIERLDPALSYRRRTDETARLIAAFPVGPDAAPYRPFDSAQVERLAESYAEDCRDLAAQGCLLRF